MLGMIIVVTVRSPASSLESPYKQTSDFFLFSSNLIGNLAYASGYQVVPNQPGIPLTSAPSGIAANPLNGMVYVANPKANTLSVINNTDQLEAIIDIPGHIPYDVDVDPYTNLIYVTNEGSDSISIIDGGRNAVIENITVESPVVGIDIDSDNSWIYVTNINNDSVSKIDAITNLIVNTTKVGKYPYNVDLKGGRDPKIYVTNAGSNTVSVIDYNSFKTLKNIIVGNLPSGLAANSLTNKIYVANRADDTVYVIDTFSDRVIKKLTVGHQLDGVSISFRTNTVYVSNTGSSTVSVIDGGTDEVVKEVWLTSASNIISENLKPPANRFPNLVSSIDNNPVTNIIYVTDPNSNTILLIDGRINEPVIGIRFNINPSYSGFIYCDETGNTYDGYYVRVSNGTIKCEAKAADGFRFTSWAGTPSFLINSSDVFTSILDYLIPTDAKKQFPVGESGTLSATFLRAPQVIFGLPEQFLIAIISVLLGFFLPSLVRWFNGHLQRRRLRRYQDRIERWIKQQKQQETRHLIDSPLENMEEIKSEVSHLYTKGKISDSHYDFLQKMILEASHKSDPMNPAGFP